jgi:hypothetical protein
MSRSCQELYSWCQAKVEMSYLVNRSSSRDGEPVFRFAIVFSTDGPLKVLIAGCIMLMMSYISEFLNNWKNELDMN